MIQWNDISHLKYIKIHLENIIYKKKKNIMKYLKLFEDFDQFSVISNVDIPHFIKTLGDKLKDFSDRDMKDHYNYIKAKENLNKLKITLKSRIELCYKMEGDNDNKIMSDVIRDIFHDEGKLQFSIGMYETLLKTIDATLENDKYTPVVEAGDDYILYDQEKDYLTDLMK